MARSVPIRRKSSMIPQTEIGSLAGALLYIAAALVIVVALFTSGLGPIVLAGVVLVAIILVIYFVLKRITYRLVRGPRKS